MLSILVSLFIGASGPSLQELPVAHVESIARQVVQNVSSLQPEKPELLVANRPEPTPLGAIAYAGGRCKIIVNNNNSAWSQWGRFLTEENKPHWDSIVAASVAHEFGHCMKESRLGSQRVQLFDETLNALGLDGSVSSAMATRMLKQELFADTVALVYATNTMTTEEADAVIEAIYQARVRSGDSDPSHNTARELLAVKNSNLKLGDGETLGQAAIRILSSLSV